MTRLPLTLIALAALAAPLVVGCDTTRSASTTASNWRATLNRELPRLGHRNFIVVADKAYPLQSAPGITTLYTGAEQVATLEAVFNAIDSADHVRPVIYVDAEIDAVPEADAPGIDAYRAKLDKLLDGRAVSREPHEDIIRKLDDSAKLFNVLLLKTDMTVPYTSVFIQLDCGYWSAEKEQRLRAKLGR